MVPSRAKINTLRVVSDGTDNHLASETSFVIIIAFPPIQAEHSAPESTESRRAPLIQANK